MRQGDEERELQWAGVLELVDINTINALRERGGKLRVLEQPKRQPLLVDEIDQAPCAFVRVIGQHRLSGAGENRLDIGADIGDEARMARENARRLTQGLKMGVIGLGAAELRHSDPVAPDQIGGLLAAKGLAQVVERSGRAFGQPIVVGIAREQVGRGSVQRAVEARFRLAFVRRGRDPAKALDGAARERCEQLRRHVVGARLGDDVVDIVAPVALDSPFEVSQPATEVVEPGRMARDRLVCRLVEGFLLRVLADDLRDGRETETERELLDQGAADAVDGADPRPEQTHSLSRKPAFQQALANPLPQLFRRLDGECGRQNVFRIAAGDHLRLDHRGEFVGFSSPGRRGDDVDAVEGFALSHHALAHRTW